jgi:TrmH family RNA methyltransferase
MTVRKIQSKQNARLKELRRALAQGRLKENGLVAIEGPNLLEEALHAQLRIACVFLEERMQHWLQQVNLPDTTEVLVMPAGILSSALTTETPQPVAALVEVPDWTLAHVLGPGKWSAPLILVLAALQDPGNLGTILRSAEAFGASGVIALPGTVSQWNPKAVRASAGSVFRMPLIATTPEDCFSSLRKAGIRVLTTTVRAAEPLDFNELTRPTAFLIGNEGSGVPDNLAAYADEAITIPCPGAVESLNAAVAASVLLYESSRQRLASSGGPQNRRGSQR